MKFEEASLAQVVAIVDPEDVGSFSLAGILEAALSTVEEKQVRFPLAALLLQCLLTQATAALMNSQQSAVLQASCTSPYFDALFMPLN